MRKILTNDKCANSPKRHRNHKRVSINGTAKYIKQQVIELKQEMDKYSIAAHFNICFHNWQISQTKNQQILSLNFIS